MIINPFATDLPGLIGDPHRPSDRPCNRQLCPALLDWARAKAPGRRLAGDDRGRLASNRLRSTSTFSSLTGNSRFHRNEQSIRGALDIPLTSRDNGFLPQVGNLDATAEYSRVHFSDAGTIDHHALGLTWEPVPPLRLGADIRSTERPAAIQTLGNPVIVSPDVRVFDPLTGETVDVVQITGGNPTLLPEKTKIRRVNALLRLVPRLNLQLNAEYTDTDARHFVSSLPEASAAVMLAFPDRFIRDPNGVLTTIDLRPVNFNSHREKRLRYGLSLATSIGGDRPAPVPASAETPRGRGPRRAPSRRASS